LTTKISANHLRIVQKLLSNIAGNKLDDISLVPWIH